jgi:hypothetical protein
MRKPTGHGVAWHALSTTLAAPVVRLNDPADQHRMIVIDPLASHRQAKAIQQTEAIEITATESSVRHVEVFQADGVGTSIIGRPRPSPGD